MARKSTIFARAVRRANISLKRLSAERGRSMTHLGSFLFTCPYCSKTLQSLEGRERHINLKPYCRARRIRELDGYVSSHMRKKLKRKLPTGTPDSNNTPTAKRPQDNLECEDMNKPSAKRMRPDDLPTNGRDHTQPPIVELPENLPDMDGIQANTSRPSSIEFFPILTAGTPVSSEIREQTMAREDLQDYLASCGDMGQPEKFEVAELLMTTGLNGKNRTRHLKSCLTKGKNLWCDNRKLLEDVDRLPYGPKWVEEAISVGEGIHCRTHTVFRRDIVEVIRELIGDPRFEKHMKYAPERHWSSSKREHRLYGEMWSGNWWWRTQYIIRDPYGTIVPLVIASDKTTLSTMAGGQHAYPVYVTIGNISKDIRRKASKRATVILGYLPVDSFKDVTNDGVRMKLRGELVHRAMEAIFEPLKAASRDGVLMWCADNRQRRVYPILAAFVGDWPEQNDMSCTVRSGCPICLQRFHGRGSGETNARHRNQEDTVAAFSAYRQSNKLADLRELNLKPWIPFWADLPYVDFPSCITPDILHQCHKGVFSNYIAEWVEELLGEDTLNERFAAMPQAKDLRHFKTGITNVQQWTGRETKDMVKQFLPIIAEDPAIPEDFVSLNRSLLDFLYLAERARLSEAEIQEMDKALRTFHSLKKVLVELELMADLTKFDEIPKFHMLGHYTHSIRELGTPDGYNTESPEHLHIIYAKRGWRASNRRDAAKQIIKYIQRLEAIRIHRAYMDEYFGESPRLKLETSDCGDGDDEDDDDVDDSDEEQGADEEMTEMEASDSAMGAYPRPTLSMAVHPTCRRLTGQCLVSTYGATDLLHSLRRFLRPLARKAGPAPVVLLSDLFDVWHKLTLHHQPIPFAPYESLHCDVLRMRLPSADQHGHQAPGVFDTLLFLHQPQQVGLKRFRAGRIRAIFTLPTRLHSLFSGRLAYVELFTPFKDSTTSPHRMHTVSHDLRANQRQGLVIPVEHVVMGCHLGPRFSTLPSSISIRKKPIVY